MAATASWKLAQRSAMSCSRQRRARHRLVPERGLEPGQREMRLGASEHRPRQLDRGPAARGVPLNLRPAGIAQAQQLGRLVEGLAERIVERRAEPLVGSNVLDDERLGMSARDEQQEIGEAEAVGETGGQRMRLQMIDRDEGERRARARSPCPWSRPRSARRSGLGLPPRRRRRLHRGRARPRPSAWRIAASSSSTWARAAISGTTPP